VDFSRMLHPKTIAVAGVSLANDRHPANVIYNKIHLRYPVKVYPVNPRGGRLRQDRVYQDITEIPSPIDLTVVATRAEFVENILKACIAKKAGGAVIVSGGFAESGRKDLQEALVQLARPAGFPFIGPNCLGIYAPNRFDTFFLPGERLIRPDPGGVAIVSQSGGVLVDQMVKFAEQGIGLSLAVSIGNKALIREMDLLEYLSQDADTRVIAFYIEGFEQHEGRRFVEAASRVKKPIIILKAGKSAVGRRAAGSHTASLAGDYRIFSDVLAQHGIVEAKNEFEMVAFCESLSCYRESITGNIGIITASGGHGVLASDACAACGLTVPPLDASAQSRIREGLSERLGGIASLQNPIDLTGSAEDNDFVAAAAGLNQIPEIDCILLLLLPYSPGISADLGARMSYIFRGSNKPLVAYVPHQEKYRMLIEGFELNNVPVSSSIEGAVLMAEALRRSRPC